jgi:hypothetical protein
VHGDELEVELHDVGPADQVGGARDGSYTASSSYSRNP